MPREVARRLLIAMCALAFTVGVIGCGGSAPTSSTHTSSMAPPPAPASATPRLTGAGYAAFRDTVAFAARIAPAVPRAAAAVVISNIRKSCPHLGYDPGNSQVKAVRAECEASARELSTYVALRKCRQAVGPATRRACFVRTVQRLAAILRREINLDDALVAGLGAGPCRDLLLVGYADNVRVMNASDRAAHALQTAKTASDVLGPLRAWQSALTAMFADERREAPSLKRQFPECRPR